MVKHKSYGRGGDEVSSQSVPVVVDAPYIAQAGAQLSCTMGNWDETATPDSFSYQWTLDGEDVGVDSATHTVTPEDVGKTATCELTATNVEGSATAASNSIVVEDQGFAPPPFNPEAPLTYKVLEDTVVDDPENPGETIAKAKDEEVTMTYTQARKLIDSGVRIVGID